VKTENTPQSASEKAAVMLAFDRGEKVERCFRHHEIWLPDYSPSWDWLRAEWRVALKPIESWIWVYADGKRGYAGYDSKLAAEGAYKGYTGRAVFMREVIE